jgi:pyruvate formate lyase activating enzyme
LGPDVPLHFTAFHPDFKLRDKPRTPAATLHAARKAALEAGLHYVYEGNIYSDGAHTFCPSCKTLLLRRSWHDVQENRLVKGRCPGCDLAIAGRWTSETASASLGMLRDAQSAVDERYGELNF